MPVKKPSPRPETEYTYTNKFSEKEIRFNPKPDEIVATFGAKPNAEVAGDVKVLMCPGFGLSETTGPQSATSVLLQCIAPARPNCAPI